jgi:cytochrome c
MAKLKNNGIPRRDFLRNADAGAAALAATPSTPAKQDPWTAANPGNGQRLFVRDGCYECHGYQGQGSTSTGGTRLGPSQIPPSAFISYVGDQPAPCRRTPRKWYPMKISPRSTIS